MRGFAAAAFDVFEEEPAKPDHPLLTLDNFISTPHIGASTTEAQENVAVGIAEHLIEEAADLDDRHVATALVLDRGGPRRLGAGRAEGEEQHTDGCSGQTGPR